MKANFDKGTKICSKCKRELPIDNFQKNCAASDGLTCRCKECLSAKNLTEEERKRRVDSVRKYQQTLKGRANRDKQNERRRNDSEYKERARQKRYEYYHKYLANPKKTKEIEVDENGNEFFTCSTCGRRLSIDCFHLDNSTRLGINFSCKDCKNKQQRDRNHTEEGKEYNRQKMVKYRKTDYSKEYRKEYNKNRICENEQARINLRLHNNLNKLIHRSGYKGLMLRLVGCSRKDFIDFIESQFKVGMSWDNYGKIWHIDHIVPCSYFDLTDEEEQRVCFNWRNTQPLFSKDNFSKGNNVLEGSQELVDFICQELNIKKKIILKLRTREE